MSAVPEKEVKARIQSVRQHLKEAGLDGVLVQTRPNTFYMSGFTGSCSLILITSKKAVFITDCRYIEVCRREVKGYEVVLATDGLPACLTEVVQKMNLKTVGFEGEISFDMHTDLRKAVKPASMKRTSLVTDARLIKSTFENGKLQRAQVESEKIFNALLDFIKPGVTELDIRNFIVHGADFAGLDGISFDPIIASGKNSSLPHAHPTKRKIAKRDIITIDMGVIYDGYCSDMTRTIFMGKPTAQMTEIYGIVRQAQQIGIDAVRAGVHSKDVDKAVRDFITEAGYGPNFGHGTGHGVGIEIHESPRASKLGKHVLEPNMNLTIEPGIYFEGKFGIRIEDTVIVTADGCKNLMKTTKDMICL